MEVADMATIYWPPDTGYYDPDMQNGVYPHDPSTATFRLDMRVGEHTFQVPLDALLYVFVSNRDVADSLQAFSLESAWVSDLDLDVGLRSMTLTLQDDDATAFASDALPPTLDAAEFELREIFIGGGIFLAPNSRLASPYRWDFRLWRPLTRSSPFPNRRGA
ncbi:MAG: hypothetical protein R3C10_07310 [Pirellulales bacterium]